MSRVRHPRHIFWLGVGLAFIFGLVPVVMALSGADTSPLVINELVAANGTGLTDEAGRFSDWIELHNRTPQPLNLSGWSLTDDPNQPTKWSLPDMTLPAHGYLVIFASGDNLPLHANFRLSQSSEFIGLYNQLQGKFMDSLSYPTQQQNIAYGRHQGHFAYLSPPSPGQPNQPTSSWAALTPDVTFSAARGLYQQPFSLTLTSLATATIRYTLDGSPPTASHGQIYRQPLPITQTRLVRAIAVLDGHLPAAPSTHTYLFLDSILSQTASPLGFPATWGHMLDGQPVLADYELDPELVTDPRFGPRLPTALSSLPAVSIVLPPEDFTTLYSNPKQRGIAWERLGSVELFDPSGQESGFQADVGLRIHGGIGRNPDIPKHNLRLFFRGEYGQPRLDYPLFSDSPVTEFNTLVLRAGVNRSYAGLVETKMIRTTTYARDEWLRASQIEMSGLGSHGRFVHLYLNGLYWGLYNLVERPDAAFAASYLGGDPTDWFAINHGGPVSGDPTRFAHLDQMALDGNLADPARYAEIQHYLDIPHFIDYIILNNYSGNQDWGLNNWYAVMPHADGPAKYFVWDGEATWIDGGNLADPPDYAPRMLVEDLFKGLLENSEFRIALADHIYRHLFNDGPLSPAQANARWERITDPLDPAIIAESARWGDTRFQPPLTRQDWLAAVDDVRQQMITNVETWLVQLREAGYYPPLDPPRFNQRGGEVAAGFAVTLTPPHPDSTAAIYYTLDGSDPRQPLTGQPSPTAHRFTEPISINQRVTIKSRAFQRQQDGVWSALNEATFYLRLSPGQLQITELMYHPKGGGQFEFLELKNSGTSSLDLAGVTIDGLNYQFPGGQPPLPPGELLVLVRDAAAFALRYPTVPIGGEYQGKLSNRGETLRFIDWQEQELLRVTYQDAGGWPITADGWGDSLVFVNQQGDPNDPLNWRASSRLHGSPGEDSVTNASAQ